MFGVAGMELQPHSPTQPLDQCLGVPGDLAGKVHRVYPLNDHIVRLHGVRSREWRTIQTDKYGSLAGIKLELLCSTLWAYFEERKKVFLAFWWRMIRRPMPISAEYFHPYKIYSRHVNLNMPNVISCNIIVLLVVDGLKRGHVAVAV